MESAIEQAVKQIEQNLKDCTCKDLVVSLLRRHPDSSADFVLLSEQINQDRQFKPCMIVAYDEVDDYSFIGKETGDQRSDQWLLHLATGFCS